LRSTMKTVSAPAISSFRGSIPHPTQQLCTLRVRRCRRLTQHSLPGGPTTALPGPDLHRLIAPALPGAFPHPITSSRSTRAARSAAWQIKREFKRRAAIEPVISHLKEHPRMGRNYLAHASGDAINAVLAAAGYNFPRLLQWLRLLLLRILIALSLAAQLKSVRNRVLHGRLIRTSRATRRTLVGCADRRLSSNTVCRATRIRTRLSCALDKGRRVVLLCRRWEGLMAQTYPSFRGVYLARHLLCLPSLDQLPLEQFEG
jgi:hypothetical protein